MTWKQQKIVTVQLTENVILSKNHTSWQNLLISFPLRDPSTCSDCPLPSVNRVNVNSCILTCISCFQNCFRTFCPSCHADIPYSHWATPPLNPQPTHLPPLPQNHHQRPSLRASCRETRLETEMAGILRCREGWAQRAIGRDERG